jgi:hypothetical protein
VSRNAFRVDDLQTVHIKQVLQALQRVVAQVFVINRVVLQRFNQPNEIVRLGNEHAVVVHQMQNEVDDLMDVLYVGEHVRRRHDRGGPFVSPHFRRDGRAKNEIDVGIPRSFARFPT